MKKTEETKKLKLNTETLRNLKPNELEKVAGGRPAYPTETEVASGCEVTLTTCTCGDWC
jgi:hypothetical protein